MIGNGRLRALLLAVMVVVAVGVALVAPLDDWSRALMEADLWRHPRGIVVFVALYVLWNFVFPPAPLQVLAGLHYGVFGGLAAVVVATSLANMLSHGVARLLGRTWVAEQAEHSQRLRALEQAVDKMGWKAVALLRLSNLIPSNLANLLMGVTPLKLPTILWASILGSLPGWGLMLGFGHGGRMFIDADSEAALPVGFYIVAAVAAVLLLAALGRRAHKILEETTQEIDDGDDGE